jgi:sec-independent protein translocase protein TatB
MFDIGFFELLVIGIVGLFVIGPERLPDTIKSVAIWISRVKRSLLNTRQEIEQQIGADEIRREIYNEQILHNLEKMKDTKTELEQRINQWKEDTLKEDAYLEHEVVEDDIHASHKLEPQTDSTTIGTSEQSTQPDNSNAPDSQKP